MTTTWAVTLVLVPLGALGIGYFWGVAASTGKLRDELGGMREALKNAQGTIEKYKEKLDVLSAVRPDSDEFQRMLDDLASSGADRG